MTKQTAAGVLTAIPHAPQLVGSVVVSTQVASQSVSPGRSQSRREGTLLLGRLRPRMALPQDTAVKDR